LLLRYEENNIRKDKYNGNKHYRLRHTYRVDIFVVGKPVQQIEWYLSKFVIDEVSHSESVLFAIHLVVQTQHSNKDICEIVEQIKWFLLHFWF